MTIARGCVGQYNWHTPHPTHPSDRTHGGPPSTNKMASEPNGQRSTQIVQSSPAVLTQVALLTTARPIRIRRPSKSGVSAPLGQTCVHCTPSQSTQAARSGSIAGDPAASPYDESSGKIACTGQVSIHLPQRRHVLMKPDSSIAPGGRKRTRGSLRGNRSARNSANGCTARSSAPRKNPRRFKRSRFDSNSDPTKANPTTTLDLGRGHLVFSAE